MKRAVHIVLNPTILANQHFNLINYTFLNIKLIVFDSKYYSNSNSQLSIFLLCYGEPEIIFKCVSPPKK